MSRDRTEIRADQGSLSVIVRRTCNAAKRYRCQYQHEDKTMQLILHGKLAKSGRHLRRKDILVDFRADHEEESLVLDMKRLT